MAFVSFGQYTPSNSLNYVKLLKTPPAGTKSDSVLVWNGTDKFVYMVPSSEIGGGDFIPLSGTTDGNPITGDLEMNNGSSLKSISDNGGNPLTSKLLFADSANIISSLDSGETAGIYMTYDNVQIEQVDNLGNIGTAYINNLGLRVESTNPDSKGIISTSFFDKQNDPLAYPQNQDVYDQFNAVNLGTYFYDNLAIKSTPSPDDEIVMLDSVTGEAVTATFSSFGGGGGSGTVTSVTGVSGEITVASGTTTPVIGISSTYTTARDAHADAKVANTITDGVTTSAPNQDVVFDALALKAPINNASFTGTFTLPNGALSITSGSASNYIRADGVSASFTGSVRVATVGTVTPSNIAIASSDMFTTIVNKTQGQINELIRMDGASGSFSATGTATTTFTVTIGATQSNTTYKVNATPTNALTAAMFYVTNKTTTTFDVVFLTGLTGAVAFDWTLKP